MKKKSEIEKTEDSTALAPSELFDVKQNMEDVEPRLPQVGIIHQGQLFDMPSGKKEQTITGIILDINRANAFWFESFDKSGGGTPPDCCSLDGMHVGACETPQADNCQSCKKNLFESEILTDGSKGKGKACKNMKRVHIMMEGCLMPLRLTLPPSNLKAIDTYITNLSASGLPYQLIETKLSLKEASNKAGIKYSEIVLENVREIDMNTEEGVKEGTAIKKERDLWYSVMRGQEIVAAEYAGQGG